MIRLIKGLFRKYKIKKDPINYARDIGVEVGTDCRFLGIQSGTFGSEPYLIKIGDHVTITGQVQFITHDGGVWVFREEYQEIDVFGKIIIGNNVFIGYNTIILPGVIIGDNVVIGAGSVVTKSIPSNTVAAGVPAKVITSYDVYKEKSLGKTLNTKNLDKGKKKEVLINNL
jgi:acetyltransferase-like isoleucine patch superfamily enzyme